MINVIKLTKDGTTENYKVKYRYFKQTLTFEENIEYYHKTMVKVKKLFLQENQRIFIGCIRDDHDNHGSERRKTKCPTTLKDKLNEVLKIKHLNHYGFMGKLISFIYDF